VSDPTNKGSVWIVPIRSAATSVWVEAGIRRAARTTCRNRWNSNSPLFHFPL
jgi:hypothetical protein